MFLNYKLKVIFYAAWSNSSKQVLYNCVLKADYDVKNILILVGAGIYNCELKADYVKNILIWWGQGFTIVN